MKDNRELREKLAKIINPIMCWECQKQHDDKLESATNQILAILPSQEGLKITCSFCNKDLTEVGSLVFSPPDENGKCKKIHFCKDCFNKSRYAPQELMGEEAELKAIKKLMSNLAEFGHPIDPECELPPLAADVYGHLVGLYTDLCSARNEISNLFSRIAKPPEKVERCECKDTMNIPIDNLGFCEHCGLLRKTTEEKEIELPILFSRFRTP